jgi:hypothetical protein
MPRAAADPTAQRLSYPSHTNRKMMSFAPDLWAHVAAYQEQAHLSTEAEATRQIMWAGIKALDVQLPKPKAARKSKAA